MCEAMLTCRGVKKSFYNRSWFGRRCRVQAVGGVDMEIEKGHSTALVGESGCGKTTLAKMIAGLIRPDEGEIVFDGIDIARADQKEIKKVRRALQMVFQDPYSSLNPRMSVWDIVGEPLAINERISRMDLDRRIEELLGMVGLPPLYAIRYPNELSGGERQRVAIARAISLSPRLLVADEPLSALDPIVQADILELFIELKDRLGISYLFITHDIKAAVRLCDNVLVMYGGVLLEKIPVERLGEACHPYTEMLLHPMRIKEERHPIDVPYGTENAHLTKDVCPFLARCPHASRECLTLPPPKISLGNGHEVMCHLAKRAKGVL